ncbi:glycosyl transferase [Novimethylophilus kurashikiensis]|uniref:Glycosyl transferase n=1 Tax=Novimethylophilus kurashikiensis TaxID=1825523 RepID=A0A2R5F4M5_9PROT|nr:FAD-dependent oxidoreductase [Novimethylophilus kurashikiensis]GBG13347.1 glycosyl transferase [Novimethylophilus kurashikiensis]
MPPTVVVFSHLRWNFVYQRPQHLLSRLAGRYRIIFLEEPMDNAQEPFLERFTPSAYIEVLRPHVPGETYGFDDANMPALRGLLDNYLAAHEIDDFFAWFYTPMALPLLEGRTPRNVIYDCMDELSAFKNAPAQLIEREKALFEAADLVFTGGPSLYQAKKLHHPNVHCFASSVDADHFAPKAGESHIHIDVLLHGDIPHPRLGYYGVIDERIDLDLIAALADARPDWQIVMVGPVVKIDPESLPQRPNIHWMGQHTYEELPHFLAGWDLCLLPFALNESTRFISPTKTLEYMAAQRPMVSTRIKDVAEPYGHVVPIARSHEEFVADCARLLEEPEKDRAIRIDAMRRIVAKTSWDKTALAMHNLIAQLQPATSEEATGVVPLPVAIHNAPSYNVPVTATPNTMPEYDTIILGAGPTGLSAAYHLGEGSLLLEAQPTVGGWCRSIEDNGFTFDFAGHIMFSNDDYVLEMYKKLLGNNIHWQNREAWIYSKEVYTRYPFQGALYGLPPDVLKECVMGAIEARFGPLKKEDRRAAASSTEKGGVVGEARPPQNFEEFIYKVWGAGVAKHFAIPYNKKLWAVPLTEMETSWLGNRVPMPDLEEMIEGALKPVPKPMGPNARFGYPLKGGFQALMNGFLPHLKGDLQFNARVVGVSPSKRIVTLADGRRFRYDNLISTLPLPKLVQAMGDEATEDLKQAAAGLRHVSVRCVNLGIGRPNITEKHWVYYPEYPIFHRIFLQGNASPHCNPPGGFGLTCEITYSEYKPLPYSGPDLIQRCIDDCIRVGMIQPDDEIWAANEIDIPYAYVVYDHERSQNVGTIRDWTADNNIVLAGRYSEWEYYNSDHAFIAGKKAAEQVAGATEDKMAANV